MMQLFYLLFLTWSFMHLAVSFEMKITMPGVTTEHDDSYICSSFQVPNNGNESYIKSYESTTNSSVAHHILLYGCHVPFSTDQFYTCGSICGDGNEKIIFAWAKDAQKFEYPNDAGMAVGGNTGIIFLVLQVHYLKKVDVKDNSGILIKLSYDVPPNLVSIGLMFSYYGDIPANTGHVNLDISCRYKGKIPAYPLAFRTHAHALGRSISGFRISDSNGKIDLIGRGNPQWPQTFYKANSDVIINPGDILMARCVYDSTGRNHATQIGSTHNDEMCNFYIMLVSKNDNDKRSFTCGGNELNELWKNVPGYSEEYSAPNPSPDLMLARTSMSNMLIYDSKWKVEYLLGEVTGVSIIPKPFNDLKYSLLVLHRVDRKWGSRTFKDNVYTGENSPISSETILQIDPVTGKTLGKSGSNIFFLPHGITVTNDGKYIWITDVALHQVMRFRLFPGNSSKLMDDKPDIVLGERFVPGNDRHHFCKPAKVAVDSKGYIFVADGYCNSRIVYFNPNGSYIDEWRTNDMMIVVHSISIAEDKSGDLKKNIVWIADRENQRIIGFRYNGNVEYIFTNKQFGMPIYAIAFNPTNRLLYGVSSNGMSDGDSFVVDYKSNSFNQKWHSNYHMNAPHDLCLAENGTVIFVAELHLRTVVKFSMASVIKSDLLFDTVISKYTSMHGLMSRTSPTFIVLAVVLAMFSLLFCVLLLRLVCRFSRHRTSKKRNYGPMYKDKDGFQPLTQNENTDEDDGTGATSDPETEEFSAPMSRIAKKPKV